MNSFSRRGQALQIKLRHNQVAVLHALTGGLIELVGPLGLPDGTDQLDAIMAALTSDNSNLPLDDPALRRLFPDAYPNDQAASGEFRRYTQADQATAKVDAARTMAADVAAADDGWVTVPPDHVEAWMITLTNLRLILAARLGINDEDGWDGNSPLAFNDPRTPTAAVYDWCGWILESLIACL
ncbi:MAG: DUF2017 domain-containing protein [Propionibacteriaceae bacterium]|nr:DUF2017 domain-containing protein [Propionibacteriaceae bacterium]